MPREAIAASASRSCFAMVRRQLTAPVVITRAGRDASCKLREVAMVRLTGPEASSYVAD
jgi:hypothetical protein